MLMVKPDPALFDKSGANRPDLEQCSTISETIFPFSRISTGINRTQVLVL